MKIVYFYQYFCTPKGSWGTRVYEFAKDWVSQGHEVTVITSVYYKSDITSGGIVKTHTIDGIKVKALNIRIDNKQSFIKRVFSFIAYSLLSSYYALTLKADLVIASSGPITVGIPGLIARYLRGRKLAFEVRDLWPLGAIEMGYLKSRLLQKVAYALERRCYKAASMIITLSPGMSEWINETYGHEKQLSIPNFSDNELFGRDTGLPEFPGFYKDQKVVLYTGNIGHVNNSELLLNAADMLRDREDILILLIGDGQLRVSIEEKAAELGLANFKILDIMPKTEVAKWVRMSMCTVVPLQGNVVLNSSSPNKLFDSLAAGTPVIQTTTGWIKKFLEEYACGFTVSASDPSELVEVILKIDANQSIRNEMGENAVEVAKTKFDKSILSRQLLHSLEKLDNS